MAKKSSGTWSIWSGGVEKDTGYVEGARQGEGREGIAGEGLNGPESLAV